MPQSKSRSPISEPQGWPTDSAFLTAIIETQNDIASVELDPPVVMRMIVERARRLTNADGAVVEMKQGHKLVASVAVGDQDTCQASDTGSLISVPLCHLSRIVGVLKVGSRRSEAFEPMHVSGLRLMAALLGAALANASEAQIKRQLLAERTAALEALAVSEERFRGAFEHAAIGVALVGLDGRWLQVNRSCCEIVGYSEAELLATDFQSVTHPDDLDADLQFVGQLIAGQIQSYRMVKRYFHKTGPVVWVVLSVSLVRNVEGHPLYFVSQIQNITENKRRESLEADQRKILEMVARDHPLDPTLEKIAEMLERQIEGSRASLLVIRDGGLSQIAPNLPPALVNAIHSRSLSLAAALAGDGQSLRLSRIDDDDIWTPIRHAALSHGLRVCWSNVVRSGEGQSLGLLTLYCQTDRAMNALDAESVQAAANLATIAIEHHAAAQRLSHLTRHDPLTGLPNRLLLEDRMEQALALACRNGKQVAVLALDLDRFKQINDTLGHQVGDHLLQLFAQRLRANLRASDTLARIGGDELIAILPDISGPEGASAAARKLVEAVRQPFTIAGHTVSATASIGIAIYPFDGNDAVSVQAHADAALYRAKHNGRNGYSL